MSKEFRILGPLEALEDGRVLDLGGPRQRAVLALLLLRCDETVTAERLIEDVWADEPPERAANTLQSYVSRLRRELGRDTITTRPGGAGLRGRGQWVGADNRHAHSLVARYAGYVTSTS